MADLVTTNINTRRKIQKIEDRLDLAMDKMGDTLEERLVQIEDAQEKLMGGVEGITTDSEMKDEEDSSTPHNPIIPLFRFPPP